MNSPKLEYAEMEKLQEVIRSLRRAGGRVNSSCGMHVHVDASKHTPQSLKNVLSIMSVSYTHLTLPTKRIVELSVVAGALQKKKKRK